MPERLFTSSHDYLVAALAMVCAIWGGLVSYFRRLEQGHKHTLFSITAHVSTSGFSGLLAWLLCSHVNTPGPITAIVCGLSGHMGVEFIRLLEQRFIKRLK